MNFPLDVTKEQNIPIRSQALLNVKLNKMYYPPLVPRNLLLVSNL